MNTRFPIDPSTQPVWLNEATDKAVDEVTESISEYLANRARLYPDSTEFGIPAVRPINVPMDFAVPVPPHTPVNLIKPETKETGLVLEELPSEHDGPFDIWVVDRPTNVRNHPNPRFRK